MTRKELGSQIRSRDRQNKWRTFIGLTLIGLWAVGGVFLDDFLNWGGSMFLRYAYSAAGFIVFAVFILCAVASQIGVPCPHCKKRLFAVAGQIAVATGNCGFCGEKVFEG
jgi:hypothetical protein